MPRASATPRRRLALAAAAVVAAAAGQGRATATSIESLPSFAYDRGLPLAVRVSSQRARGSIIVRGLSFSIDGRTRLRAYLVAPRRGPGPSPAILYVPGRRQTREFFLSEAETAAARGALALAVDDLPGAYPTFTATDRAFLIRRVVALRRAIDVLLGQPGVDATRLGVVAHSDGAELGGILAGIDRRATAYVLMCGGGIWDRSRNAAYDGLVAGVDADNYIRRAAPAALFFQSALSDQFVPRVDALRYQQLGSRPKRVRWYAADHMLNAQARADRLAWLAGRLHLR